MISVVVLAYVLNDKLLTLTKECVRSVIDQADEFIFVDNGSTVSQDWVRSRSDIFIRINKNVGYVGGINAGILAATGDHIVFVSNDTRLEKGLLKDLCDDNYSFPNVTWENRSYMHPNVNGAFFCFPNKKNVVHDRRFFTYFSDTDRFYDSHKKGEKLYYKKNIEVFHHGWQTSNVIGGKSEIYEKDRKKFIEKWNIDPDVDFMNFIPLE